MTLKHFIERPVLASVISIVIVIAGIIGLASLPVEQYPDIAPPTVMVRASYPAAPRSRAISAREPTRTWRP